MALPRVALLVILCLLGGTVAARAAGEYDRALQREQQGDLQGALQALEPAQLSGAQAAHRDALRAAAAASAAAHVYQDRDQLAQSHAVLENALQGLDAVRDVYVYSALQRQLADVDTQQASSDDDDDALGFFGFLGDLWDEFTSAAQTVLAWGLAVLAVLLVVYLIRRAGRWVQGRKDPLSGLSMALEDLSDGASARGDANRALGQELAGALRGLAQSADEQPPAPELDVTRDLDGNLGLTVRVAGDALANLGSYLEAGTPVKIGPVAVTPRQLLAFLSSTFARRYQYELSGYLYGAAENTRLALDLTCHQTSKVVRWLSADGDATRGALVMGAARRIVFETSHNPTSLSWRSVEAYEQARMLVAACDEADDPSELLQQARRLLQRSLDEDASNASARFELGNVLRKLGLNRDAEVQYSLVDGLGSVAGKPADPIFQRTVTYNRAAALAKIDAWPEHRQALELLAGLAAETEQDSDLPALTREEHLLVIHSAVAAALVFEAEHFRRDNDRDAIRQRMTTLLDEVRARRDWVVGATARAPGVNATALVHASAVAENAYGRVAYLAGRPTSEAISAFEHALALVPSLGDAHVNLASALLRASRGPYDRSERVQRHLEQALAISPNDGKAMFLQAKLYQRLGERDKQVDALERAVAAGDEYARFKLAELAWDDKRRDEAIVLARTALGQRPEPDYRARLFLLWVADPSVLGSADAETVAIAERAADVLERRAKERKRPLGKSVEAAIAAIRERPAAPPTPDETDDGDQPDDQTAGPDD